MYVCDTYMYILYIHVPTLLHMHSTIHGIHTPMSLYPCRSRVLEQEKRCTVTHGVKADPV